MVCRENPLRSGLMGYLKKRSRANGDGVFHDAEVQSSLHEFGHELEGMTPMSVEDQKAFVDQVIAQVEADPNLTDAEKYRPATGKAGQTGIVTRLRQERTALETGKDANGRPIAGTVKENTARHLASVMRMGSLLERRQPAKVQFLEMNARHRGISMQAAESEWNALMKEKGDFSQISLTDRFRDNLGAGRKPVGDDTRPATLQDSLAMAGMSARDQADLGQSGRARNAMAVMEGRRLSAIAQLPTRSTLDSPGVITRSYLPPNGKDSYIRCGGCGQFGHAETECPNDDLAAERSEIDTARGRLDNARQANQWIALRDTDDEQLQPQLTKFFPQFESVADFKQMVDSNITKLVPDGPMSERDIARAEKNLAKDEARIRSELDARGGSVSAFREIRYSPHSGLLEVTPQDYVRKNGHVTPAKPFRRRISPDTWAELTDGTDSFGKRLNALGLAREPRDDARFESAADLVAADTMSKCPTCGQFASLNAMHRCPVKGGPSEQYEARNAATQQKYRHALREGGNTLPPRPRAVRGGHPVDQRGCAAMIDGQLVRGKLSTATAGSIDADLGTDTTVATPTVAARFPDATVTGQVRVWSESGERYLSVIDDTKKVGLKCTCEQYRRHSRCPHMQAAAGACAMKFSASPAGERTPDVNSDVSNGIALDAPLGAHSRVPYETIVARRSQDNAQFVDAVNSRSYAGELLNAPVPMPPRDMKGRPTEEPTRWVRVESDYDPEEGGGRNRLDVDEIDLQDTSTVVYRLRKVLSGRPPRQSWSVRKTADGGVVVDIQKSARGTKAANAQRESLRQILGLPANNDLRDGYYIPPTRSARYEALDRAYGDPQRIQQSRWITDVDTATRMRQRTASQAARGIA